MKDRRKHGISLAGLYVILDPTVRPDRPLVQVLEAAAASGALIFQYRNKTASMKQAYDEAEQLACRARETQVIANFLPQVRRLQLRETRQHPAVEVTVE